MRTKTDEGNTYVKEVQIKVDDRQFSNRIFQYTDR